MAKTKVMIALPTSQDVMRASTAPTLAMLAAFFQSNGFSVQFSHMDSSDIVQARNYFASRVLEQTDITHLFFLDSDMGVSTSVLAKMIGFNEPIVGVAYAKRKLDLVQLIKDAKDNQLAADIQISKAMQYNVRLRRGDVLRWRGDFADVYGVGLGVTLIKAEVFHRLAPMVERSRKSSLNGATVFGFFDIIGDLTEDYSFCQRWIDQCGGRVWALSTPDVLHFGTYGHWGNFRDKFGEPITP